MPLVSGQKFNRLTALHPTSPKSGVARWIFHCSCGKEITTNPYSVRSGKTKSCGCQRIDSNRARATHGAKTQNKETLAKTYNVWQNMRRRCDDPTNADFHTYGGRGIMVCERWQNSFEAFLEDMGCCPDGMSIDRIDTDKGYSPDNCRWSTSAQQVRNTRRNIWVDLGDGTRLVLKDFADMRNVKYSSLKERIKRTGETPHQAADHLSQRR